MGKEISGERIVAGCIQFPVRITISHLSQQQYGGPFSLFPPYVRQLSAPTRLKRRVSNTQVVKTCRMNPINFAWRLNWINSFAFILT